MIFKCIELTDYNEVIRKLLEDKNPITLFKFDNKIELEIRINENQFEIYLDFFGEKELVFFDISSLNDEKIKEISKILDYMIYKCTRVYETQKDIKNYFLNLYDLTKK